MSYPSELKYTKEHEWISEAKSGQATIGVTSYAIEQLGDIVHIDLPQTGEVFTEGASFGTIESTKTVSDLYMPVGGKIVAINTAIAKSPETLQEDPYNAGWLVKIEVSSPMNAAGLMASSAYADFIAGSH